MTMSKQDLEIDEWKNLLDYVNYVGIFVVEPNTKKKGLKESNQWINNRWNQHLANCVKTREEIENPRFTHDLAVLDSMSIGDISLIMH